MYNVVAAMGDRCIRRELSIIALVCTLGIFLFPSSFGPYTSVHGPATALRAIRKATDVVESVQLNPSRSARPAPSFVAEHNSPAPIQAPAVLDSSGELILRC
jgi:hypothetical protein